MSLIKSHTAYPAPRWRPAVGEPGPAAAAPLDPMAEEAAALRLQLAALTAERDLLASRLQALEAQAPVACAAAEARGVEAGLEAGRAEAVSRAEEALERLQGSLQAGLAQLAADETALETLATQIARAALAKVFDAPVEPARLVEAAIARQLASLAAEMLVRIEVAAADFADPERLAQLARSLGQGRVHLLANPALASGDCRLKLRLGEVEIGLPQQWRRLAELLDHHVEALADAG